MTKFLLVLAAAATAHANVIIDKGSVAAQSDHNSTLSHYNASAGPIRGSVLNDVCNLSDARSLVGSHVEESQAMVWVSATVNASMPWLVGLVRIHVCNMLRVTTHGILKWNVEATPMQLDARAARRITPVRHRACASSNLIIVGVERDNTQPVEVL